MKIPLLHLRPHTLIYYLLCLTSPNSLPLQNLPEVYPPLSNLLIYNPLYKLYYATMGLLKILAQKKVRLVPR